jgi:hypothetical protein
VLLTPEAVAPFMTKPWLLTAPLWLLKHMPWLGMLKWMAASTWQMIKLPYTCLKAMVWFWRAVQHTKQWGQKVVHVVRNGFNQWPAQWSAIGPMALKLNGFTASSAWGGLRPGVMPLLSWIMGFGLLGGCLAMWALPQTAIENAALLSLGIADNASPSLSASSTNAATQTETPESFGLISSFQTDPVTATVIHGQPLLTTTASPVVASPPMALSASGVSLAAMPLGAAALAPQQPALSSAMLPASVTVTPVDGADNSTHITIKQHKPGSSGTTEDKVTDITLPPAVNGQPIIIVIN